MKVEVAECYCFLPTIYIEWQLWLLAPAATTQTIKTLNPSASYTLNTGAATFMYACNLFWSVGNHYRQVNAVPRCESAYE